MRTLSVSLLAALLPCAAAASTTYPVDAGRGLVTVYEPSTVPAIDPKPLIVLLHGLGSNGVAQDEYMGFSDLVDDEGFVFAAPNAVPDFLGWRTWNATNACCGVQLHDDAGYLNNLLDVIEASSTIDPQRVYLVGHSNGGFMSYRMACDFSGRIAAIASFAGSTWYQPADCAASEPVHILQIHGTADGVVPFDGQCFAGDCYPGAIGTVYRWAAVNQCGGPVTPGPALDLLDEPVGAETTTRSLDNCAAGGSVSLWTNARGHMPELTSNFAPRVIEYLYAHPKP